MFPHRATLALLLGSLALPAGCYQTDLAPGKGGFLCPDDLCPSGFVCRPVGGQRRCLPEGQDLGPAPPSRDQGPAAEAGRRDGGPRRDRGVQPDRGTPPKSCVAGAATRVGTRAGEKYAFAADHDPKGDVAAVAWVVKGSPSRLVVALRRGATWDGAVTVASGAASAAVSLDDGRILVAYRSESGGRVKAIALKVGRLTGGTPRTLDTADRTAGAELAFAKDASGRSVAALVYRGAVTAGISRIAGLKAVEVGRSSGGAGSRPLTVPGPLGATTYGYAPAAALDSSRNLYAVFYEVRRGLNTAYLAVRKGKTWTPSRPSRLGFMYGPLSARRVGIAVSGTRVAVVTPVWSSTAFTGGGGLIRYREAAVPVSVEVRPGGKRLSMPAGAPSIAFGDRGAQGLAYVHYNTGEVGFTARASTSAGWLPAIKLPDADDRGGRRADQVEVLPARSKVAGEVAFDLIYRREDGRTARSIFHRRVTCRF